MPSLEVYNTSGEKIGKTVLPKEIFGVKPNKILIAQAVRVYLANQRQGGAKTKTRGETAGSGRKIYRQKGTGKARHGDIRAPIFIKGGKVHGPTGKENFKLKFSQKMRRLALFSALSSKLADKEIKILNSLEKLTPKTKAMVKIFKNLKLIPGKEKINLIIPEKEDNLKKATRNLANLRVLMAKNLNTYEILDSKWLVILKPSLKLIEETYLKP